jgi:polygalacturonase
MGDNSAVLKPLAPVQADRAGKDPWDRAAEIIAEIKEPIFAPRVFDLCAYGAVGDGLWDCTDAFRKAIADCHAAGGGRVLVPAGNWASGAIHLKSNVNLHLAEGATIKFSRDPKAYLPLVRTRWEGTELLNYSSFIYAFAQRNIAITGKGTLDGQSDENHWWNWDRILRKRGKAGARHKLHQMNDENAPISERTFGEGACLRPNLITFFCCHHVLVEGVTLLRSPMWQIHPLESDHIVIRGVTMEASGPNTDGCDPESCHHVLIEDCRFNTGNDCIAIKSGRNDDGRMVMFPSADMVIRRCHMRDGHGGVTLGSEIAGGLRNIFVEDCLMDSPNLRYALRIKNNAQRGGEIEHFHCRRIAVGEVSVSVLQIDFHYEEGRKGIFVPSVRHMQLEQLTCRQCPRVAEIHSYDKGVIAPILLKDCDFAQVKRRSIIKGAPSFILENVSVNGKNVIAI